MSKFYASIISWKPPSAPQSSTGFLLLIRSSAGVPSSPLVAPPIHSPTSHQTLHSLNVPLKSIRVCVCVCVCVCECVDVCGCVAIPVIIAIPSLKGS